MFSLTLRCIEGVLDDRIAKYGDFIDFNGGSVVVTTEQAEFMIEILKCLRISGIDIDDDVFNLRVLEAKGADVLGYVIAPIFVVDILNHDEDFEAKLNLSFPAGFLRKDAPVQLKQRPTGDFVFASKNVIASDLMISQLIEKSAHFDTGEVFFNGATAKKWKRLMPSLMGQILRDECFRPPRKSKSPSEELFYGSVGSWFADVEVKPPLLLDAHRLGVFGMENAWLISNSMAEVLKERLGDAFDCSPIYRSSCEVGLQFNAILDSFEAIFKCER